MPCRDARPEDAAALARISVDAWRAAYRGLMPSDLLDGLKADDAQRDWERAFASGSTSVVAFEQDHQVVAYCYAGPSRDPEAGAATAEVIALYVHPDYWRCGVGSQLTTFALNRLATLGFDRVTLWVLRENERARRFYEAFGFLSEGTERVSSDLIGSPLREIRYCMDLKSLRRER